MISVITVLAPELAVRCHKQLLLGSIIVQSDNATRRHALLKLNVGIPKALAWPVMVDRLFAMIDKATTFAALKYRGAIHANEASG